MSISDSRVPYIYYTLPYAGKPEEITDDSEYVTGTDNYTKYLVEGLEQHVNLQGRNISMDRYFTSMTISEYLLDKGMTVVATMRSNRAGILKEMKETKSRESPPFMNITQISSQFGFICHKNQVWCQKCFSAKLNAQKCTYDQR